MTRDDVLSAAERLDGFIRRTPLLELDPEPGRPRIAVKLECLQGSGSFKLRGATNRILLDEARHKGVVAMSGGNHGLAVAHASRRLGLTADVFATGASAHKIRLMQAAGATVHVLDGSRSELTAHCLDFAERHEALFVHPFNDPAVVAGQGTVGLEIIEQWPEVTDVVVAVGGGGLASGVALAVAGSARVVPIEPVECPTLAAALEAGRPVPVEVGGIAADALGASELGEIAYAVLAPLVRRVALVAEGEILAAQRQLWERYRLAVEPAAATAWAATLGDDIEFGPDARIVVVLCGANVDPATLAV